MHRSINIQLTEQCNLSCPYCFAGTIDGNSVSMNADDMKRVLGFCRDNYIESVKITGGEPFLYRDAAKVVNELSTFTHVTVLSNLTVDNCLVKIVAPKTIALLVNVNDREQYTESEYKSFCDNLAYANMHGFDIVLGKTMYEEPFDCSQIIELCVKHNLKNIRLSHASPSSSVENVWLDSDELSSMYRYVYEMRDKFVAKGIYVIFDCPVCACKIDNAVFETLDALWGIRTHCNPRISITSRMTIENCYSTKGLVGGMSFNSFSSFDEMTHYMKNEWDSMASKLAKTCGCPDTCIHFLSGNFCGCPSGIAVA